MTSTVGAMRSAPLSAGGSRRRGGRRPGWCGQAVLHHRFNVADPLGLPRASQKPHSCRGLALESPEKLEPLKGKKFRRQHGIGPYIPTFIVRNVASLSNLM